MACMPLPATCYRIAQIGCLLTQWRARHDNEMANASPSRSLAPATCLCDLPRPQLTIEVKLLGYQP